MTDTPNASGEPDELYLDAAATEPVTRNVIEAMMPFMTDAYANPASVHQPGKTAARALDAARASFAAGLGARPDDVIFTSGGTESDNLAIKGIAMARMRALGLQPVYGLAGIDDEPSGVNPAQAGEHPAIRRPRIIISSIEHPAVAQSAQWLHEWFGFEVVHIPVDGQAHLDLTRSNRSSTARPVNAPRWFPPYWPTTRSAPSNPWRSWSASPTRTGFPFMWTPCRRPGRFPSACAIGMWTR